MLERSSPKFSVGQPRRCAYLQQQHRSPKKLKREGVFSSQLGEKMGVFLWQLVRRQPLLHERLIWKHKSNGAWNSRVNNDCLLAVKLWNYELSRRFHKRITIIHFVKHKHFLTKTEDKVELVRRVGSEKSGWVDGCALVTALSKPRRQGRRHIISEQGRLTKSLLEKWIYTHKEIFYVLLEDKLLGRLEALLIQASEPMSGWTDTVLHCKEIRKVN